MFSFDFIFYKRVYTRPLANFYEMKNYLEINLRQVNLCVFDKYIEQTQCEV